MLKSLNFHSRVLLSFVALLVLSLAGAATAMYVVAKRTSRTLAVQQLEVAERVTANALASRYSQLLNSTRTAAADYGFRQAAASGDRDTLVSAMENQVGRLHADLAAWADSKGVIASATNAGFVKAFSAGLPDGARPGMPASGPGPVVLFQGRLMNLVVVPVRAPDTIGYLCMGFFLGDDVVTQVKAISGVEVSLVLRHGEDSIAVASTLSGSIRDRLPGVIAALTGNGQAPDFVAVDGVEYLTALEGAPAANVEDLTIALQVPTWAAAAPMARLRQELLLAGAVISIICLIAAILSSRMLAKPVRALSDAARSLSMSKRGRTGLYAGNDDELAQVAKAFHALLKRAQYDALTGLPNRALLNQRLTEAITRARETESTFAVVFIDLNGFKAINDSLGHEMGDLVLRKTGQRLLRSLAQSNTVARLGGDEFVLILEDLSSVATIAEVNRLAAIVSTPMKSDAGPIKVGMSAGISIYPDTALDRETLLKEADAAMYLSKQRKRGPVVAKSGDSTPAVAPVTPVTPISALSPAPAKKAPLPDASGAFLNGTAERWLDKDLATQRLKSMTFNGAVPARQRAAEIPADEKERLAALHRIGILDRPSSPAIDRITRMTAKALGMPMVLVSLVDENRQWFMSKIGITDLETSRDVSFCAHAVFNRAPLVVSDAALDERFATNPLVQGDPGIRSYAGAPIYSTGGYALGTLCVVDRKPHDFSEESIDTLQEFAAIIQDLIRAREVDVRLHKTTANNRRE